MISFAEQAVRLAAENADAGQLPFAALVIRNDAIIATGVNTSLRDGDALAHAEVAAVRNATMATGLSDLSGAVLVSSCEPCALCHAAAVAVGITRIVYAAGKELVPDLGRPGPVATVELMKQMQASLRALTPSEITQFSVANAGEPFDRFLRQA